MKKPVIWTIGALFLFGVACSHGELGERQQQETLRVHADTVQTVTEPDRLVAPGQVSSRTDAFVSAKSVGTVLAIHVKAGDTVKKGQSMLEIDSSDVRSKLQQAKGGLAQAQAAYAIAESNYNRFKELYERNAASKVELEQMEYQLNTANGAVETAKGAVSEAKSYLRYASVTAPFDAVVVERMVNVGDFAAPGRPLFRLIDPSMMEFVCEVSESDARFVRNGTSVPVRLDNLGTSLEGTVQEVAAGSDFMTHSVRVRIGLSTTDGLKAGMYGTAVFPGIARQRILIPESWILRRGELQMVYVFGKDGRAQMRIIRTGKKYNGKVEVISGLSGNERVVTSELDRVEDGIRLEAI